MNRRTDLPIKCLVDRFLLLDKSWLLASTNAQIRALARRYRLGVSHELFFEILTAPGKEGARWSRRWMWRWTIATACESVTTCIPRAWSSAACPSRPPGCLREPPSAVTRVHPYL